MLRTSSAQASYDWLLISDLGETARSAKALRLILDRLQGQGERVAVLHWPDYQRPGRVSSAILREAVLGTVDIVLAEQQLVAQRVVLVGRHLLAYPLDQVPAIQGLQTCQVVDSVREAKLLVMAPVAQALPPSDEQPAPAEPSSLLQPWQNQRRLSPSRRKITPQGYQPCSTQRGTCNATPMWRKPASALGSTMLLTVLPKAASRARTSIQRGIWSNA